MEWFSPERPVWQSTGAPAVSACEEQSRQADTALRHSEALYRSIISTSPDGYWLV